MENLKVNDFAQIGEAEIAGPKDCTGNACSNISLRATFHPGTTMVRSILVHNAGNKTADVKITWGGVFTPCSATSSDSVFPNSQVELFTPNEYISGYCKIKANHQ